ncbi:hypothetical protein ACFL35_02380 [Candidatus Riflebacteria bacterium]
MKNRSRLVFVLTFCLCATFFPFKSSIFAKEVAGDKKDNKQRKEDFAQKMKVLFRNFRPKKMQDFFTTIFSTVYGSQEKPEEIVKKLIFLEQLAEKSWKNEDFFVVKAKFYHLLGIGFFDYGKMNNAEKLLIKSLALNKKKDFSLACETFIYLAKVFITKKQPDKAHKAALSAKNLARKQKIHNLIDTATLMEISTRVLKQGKIQSGEIDSIYPLLKRLFLASGGFHIGAMDFIQILTKNENPGNAITLIDKLQGQIPKKYKETLDFLFFSKVEALIELKKYAAAEKLLNLEKKKAIKSKDPQKSEFIQNLLEEIKQRQYPDGSQIAPRSRGPRPTGDPDQRVIYDIKNFNPEKDNREFFDNISDNLLSFEIPLQNRINALVFINKQVEKYWKDRKFNYSKGFIFHLFGISLMDALHFEKAEEFFKKSQRLLEKEHHELRCQNLMNLSRIVTFRGQNFHAHSYALSALQQSKNVKNIFLKDSCAVLELATRFYGDNSPKNPKDIEKIMPSVKRLVEFSKGPHPEVLTLVRSMIVNNMPKRAIQFLNQIKPFIPKNSLNLNSMDELNFLRVEALIEINEFERASKILKQIQGIAIKNRDSEKYENALFLLNEIAKKKNTPVDKILANSEKLFQQFPDFHERMAVLYYKQCEESYYKKAGGVDKTFNRIEKWLEKGFVHLAKSEYSELRKQLPIKFLRGYSVWHRMKLELLIHRKRNKEALNFFLKWQTNNLAALLLTLKFPQNVKPLTISTIQKKLKMNEVWLAWQRGIGKLILFSISKQGFKVTLFPGRENIYHNASRLTELYRKKENIPERITQKVFESLLRDLNSFKKAKRIYILPTAGFQVLPLNVMGKQLKPAKELYFTTAWSFNPYEGRKVNGTYNRYHFKEALPFEHERSFLQAPRLNANDPANSKFYTNRVVFMDLKALMES